VPKKKAKAKRAVLETEQLDTRTTLRARMVRWAAISVILALLLSLLVAAISVSPSSAATPTPQAACPLFDTDGDAITNDIDPDIDGDDVVNGLDEDIDGDEIMNSMDTDPASTICNDTGVLPIMPAVPLDNLPEENGVNADTTWIAIVGVALLGIGYLVLRRVRASKK
jgi:LPXTG-motif cell wall-anchored protein